MDITAECSFLFAAFTFVTFGLRPAMELAYETKLPTNIYDNHAARRIFDTPNRTRL